MVVRDTDTGPRGKLFQQSQLLPQTRSQLAIPLYVGETSLGVLDVQSASLSAFTSEEIASLETLAAQLSIAIQNARAFTEQQQTARRLKEMDKLKTQFLANMSHELRTPLNSIIGFSRVILKGIDGPLTELQKTDLSSIHNSGQHLLSLINNILDLSKIEAGKMELNLEEVQIEPIIKGVMSTAIALVKDKPVDLLQEVPDNLPSIWADPTRLRQIILNLVSNACKFTDEGAITIRAQAQPDKMIISVSDTGIGIPEEKIDSIFDEFTQVDASTTRKVGGTGLGLPISRHFVEMHHGQIWVESRLGYGSTFNFFIPIKPLAQKPEPVEAPLLPLQEKLVGQRQVIVAIDDDHGVITLYERYLEPHNYQVIGISNSYEVVPQIKELNPAIILLDVLMPKKDGWGVLRNLKDDPQTKDIPVIICSIINDKKRGLAMGAADYLVKPIIEQDLVSAVKHLGSLTKNQVKVLVIDDQADDILLIRRMLEAQAYKIIEARNGKDGLELAQLFNPHLIILDLTMPGLDGFAVVQALKNNQKTQTIPIIIVSARDFDPTEQQALSGQVEVLLRKGIFTENELFADVSQALKRIQTAEAG
jgi:signal transduction histidine kinase/CheY-like chemotaxis protein